MLQVHTLTANTSLTMPPDKLESFATLLLDGQQWVTTASGDWALAVIGRSISAPGRHRVGLSAAAIRSLPVREVEMAAFATTLDAAAHGKTSAGPVGNRMYFNSDTMVHRRATYAVVIRMRSKKTVAARCINGACLKAQHVADGAIHVYPTDSAAARFLSMPAVWDWHSLPGITAATDSPFFACDPKISEALGYQWPLRMPGGSFVGGVSDGSVGAAAMQFGHGGGLLSQTGLVLSRSHFLFDDTIVVLGAGLSSKTPHSIATTLANERLSGSVWMDDGKGGSIAVAPGNHTFCVAGRKCPAWIWHNGTGHVLRVGEPSAPLPLEVNITNRTGDFASLTAHAVGTAATRRTVETYSVRILHGKVSSGPGRAFGYALLPAVPAELMPKAPHDDSLLLVTNNPSVQAVAGCGGGAMGGMQVQAVFWPPAQGQTFGKASVEMPECVFGANVAMTVDMPSIVLVRRLNSSSVAITASGVDRGGALSLQIAGVSLRCGSGAAAVRGAAASTAVTLAMPTDPNLVGKSVATVCDQAAAGPPNDS